MNEAAIDTLQYTELDAMDAPDWESFYRGVIVGLGLVGAVVVAT